MEFLTNMVSNPNLAPNPQLSPSLKVFFCVGGGSHGKQEGAKPSYTVKRHLFDIEFDLQLRPG